MDELTIHNEVRSRQGMSVSKRIHVHVIPLISVLRAHEVRWMKKKEDHGKLDKKSGAWGALRFFFVAIKRLRASCYLPLNTVPYK